MRPGQRIGKYVLGERIAVGGMAEVWAARVEGPQGFVKTLALKFILESFSGDPELERLFVNEARIAAQLQHANLVTVFDFDKIGAEQERGLAGRYYIAMERVEGFDLRRLASAAQAAGYVFPEGLALHLAGEVLKGLRFVHERREGSRHLGLVHRDVSPHNVLVGYSGEVKLSDFGIAKARAHTGVGTKTGNIRGKLSYASPEQVNGEIVDHRTDQFALGVTLWELLAGRRLFEGKDELEIMGKVVRCDIPPAVNPQSGRAVDQSVERVLRRMLGARREDRYPTTADALSAVLSLPAYTGDGAALGDLMRTLFQPSAGLPVTRPIESPQPAPSALPATRTMNPEPRVQELRHERAKELAKGRPFTPPRSRPSRARRESGEGAPDAADIDTEDVRRVPRHRGLALVMGAAFVAAAAWGVMTLLGSSEQAAVPTFVDEPAAAPAAKLNAELPSSPPPAPAPAPPPIVTPPVAAAPPVVPEPEPVVDPEPTPPIERPESAAVGSRDNGVGDVATASPYKSRPARSPSASKAMPLAAPKAEPPNPQGANPPTAPPPTAPPPTAPPPVTEPSSRKAAPTNGAPILE